MPMPKPTNRIFRELLLCLPISLITLYLTIDHLYLFVLRLTRGARDLYIFELVLSDDADGVYIYK